MPQHHVDLAAQYRAVFDRLNVAFNVAKEIPLGFLFDHAHGEAERWLRHVKCLCCRVMFASSKPPDNIASAICSSHPLLKKYTTSASNPYVNPLLFPIDIL